MPPKQVSLHAFFGGERAPKRPRAEQSVRTEEDDSDDAVAYAPIPREASSTHRASTPTTPPSPRAAAPANLLAVHRFDPNDAASHAIHAKHSFAQVVQPTVRKGPVKYTPLELQILQLKKENPGVLLLVEVGYKMKFYQEDAQIASQVLNIVCVTLMQACFPEKNLQAAMIPVPRLAVHVKRLVAAGYKVGVCRQTETRALKAATENANKPFTRALTALYTASTWIDDIGAVQSPEELGGEQVLVSFAETPIGAARMRIGVVAVDIATASVTYDVFVDDAMRSVQLVLARGTSVQTERVLRAYAAQLPGERPARIEEVEAVDVSAAAAALADAAAAWDAQVLPLLMSLDTHVQCAAAQLVRYLSAYGLTWAFAEAGNYAAFQDRTCMLLSGNTLRNLELMHNATDGQVYGSLLWHLDHCRTPMGKRLLRQWLRRPLLDAARIAHRADAVNVLRERRLAVLHQAVAMLTRLPDLARGLARIAYGLVEPTELATVLLSLHRITREFSFRDAGEVHSGSEQLDATLAALSTARESVATHLAAIRISEARKNAKTELFADAARYPAIAAWKQQLSDDEVQMAAHLDELRVVLRRPKLQYTSVSGLENLIEVRASEASKTPADWVRVNSTKAVVRFHTPTVLRLARLREQHREQLAEAGRVAWRDFVQCVARDYGAMRRVVRAVAELDALTSLADVASLPGYTRPTLTDEDAVVLRGFRHPVLEALRPLPYVPNDVSLGGASPRAVLLTGANMGGKSSTVRALALVLILAQIGSFVPCTEARMPCHDAILTRMGAHDHLARGKSTFLVEAEETAHLLRTATPRSLLLLDEFGRGTSTFDGAALAYAVLHTLLAPEARPKVLFITHYAALGALADELPGRIANLHMATRLDTHGDHTEVVFLHTLRAGLAPASLGVYVAGLAGLPAPLVEAAVAHARACRAAHDATAYAARMQCRWFQCLVHKLL
ncbi:Mismatch repair protein msh3 [Malassezia brasiliensis]|uniref:MutS protein homolog 3 n=1 Tax=Malassezia brasiliensis TaxID=1821822 RepID=A0AAF0DQR7_9BASI|nr:Mismatch repair protein msh3 [Malassezia brasiliensis]